MRKSLLLHALLSAVLLAAALPSFAEDWSVGGGVGPFVFGKFATRTSAVGSELPGSTTTSRLSAATRPGVAADIEYDFAPRIGLQFGAAWTYAPLQLKGSGSNGVIVDAG